MRIVSSEVDLRAESMTSVLKTREARVRAWLGDEPQRAQQSAPQVPSANSSIADEFMSISNQAREIVASINSPSSYPPPALGTSDGEDLEDFEVGSKDQIDSKLIELMLHMARVDSKKKHGLQENKGANPQGSALVQQDTSSAAKTPSSPPKQGWGVEIDIQERSVKSQVTSFQARGNIVTADGRTIHFREDVRMERAEITQKEVSIRAGDAVKQAVDPLVVNLDGGPVDLGSGTISFDIDADGDEDSIAELGDGHAFLALDRNADGIINDGKELFGPQTGSGFGELAPLDEDKSGWIDEGDAAYAKLSVWRPEQSGTSPLRTLASTGIGAIYVGSTATRIDLGAAGQEARAVVQQTGITVSETGAVGTIQHVDFKA